MGRVGVWAEVVGKIRNNMLRVDKEEYFISRKWGLGVKIIGNA